MLLLALTWLIAGSVCQSKTFETYLKQRNAASAPKKDAPVKKQDAPTKKPDAPSPQQQQPAKQQPAKQAVKPAPAQPTRTANNRPAAPVPRTELYCDAARQAEAWRRVGAHNKTLLFAIPTVSRPHDKDYLQNTVDSLLDQIEALAATRNRYFGAFRIVVFSFETLMRNSGFRRLHDRWHESAFNDRLRRYVELVELGENVRLRNSAPAPGDKHLPPMTDKHYQQTLDYALMFLMLEHRNAHVNIVVEDDLVMCAGALPRIVDDFCFLDATHGPHWGSLRMGIGFMGMAFPGRKLHSMRRYWQRYYLIKPCDLLHDDWAQSTLPGANRYDGVDFDMLPHTPISRSEFFATMHIFHPRQLPRDVPAQERYVLFGHKGDVSSVGNTNPYAPYACHEPLRDRWAQAPGHFYSAACDRYNVWPCE